MSEQGEENGVKKKRTFLTPRQIEFIKLLMSGAAQGTAYKKAYKRPKILDEDAWERGYRIANGAAVKAELDRLRGLTAAKTILSLNDRLEILARDAQTGGSTPSEKNARARSIEVYSKISGDQAPERHEVSGPGGAPMAVAATTQIVNVAKVPIRERMALMREARRLAAEREAVKPVL